MRTFAEVWQYEIAYQARRPLPWIFMSVIFAITLQICVEGFADVARERGLFLNSPFYIDQLSILTSAMAWLASAAFTGDAAARDAQSRMAPLVYTSSVGKLPYLGGRLLAAFALNAVTLLAVPLALWLSVHMPGVPTEVVGPQQLSFYLNAYFVIALPNAIVATALFFSVAAVTRRGMVGYIGAVMMFFLMLFAWQVVAVKLGQWDLAKLIDPVGLVTFSEFSRTTTPAQKNTVSVSLDRMLLNRLFWLGIATVALSAMYGRFRFEHVAARRRRRHASDDATAVLETAGNSHVSQEPAGAVPMVLSFGPATRTHQLRAIMAQSFREVALSWGGLLLVVMTAILVAVGPASMSHLGIPKAPTTNMMASWVGNRGELLWMIVPLLTIYYVGELLWRERESAMHEISDAAPVPEWVRFAGKFAGLALVFLAYHLMLIAACMAIQAQLGYTRFELLLYVKQFIGIQLTEHLMFAMLAFVVHVLVNQKYVGHMAMIMIAAFLNLPSALGIEHRLLVFGSEPGWEYSDLRGFGPFMTPFAWFKMYWAAWSLLLAVLTTLFWIRGRETLLADRLRIMKRRFSRPTQRMTATAALLVVTVGGFIFYNTNVLNAYETGGDITRRRVEYEKRYGSLREAAQPSLTGTALHIELYPERREASVRATYHVVNRTTRPLDSIVLATSPAVSTGVAHFSKPARRVVADDRLNVHVYRLGAPLAPGDSLQFSFDVVFHPLGFTNRMLDAAVAPSATYFRNRDWLPSLGYQSTRELTGAGVRADQGLPPHPPAKTLEDSSVRYDMRNATRMSFEAVVGTSGSQTAVAPGALRRTWTEDGRAYFHYVADAPIRNDFAIFSAHYALREVRSNGVLLQVFHHPEHALGVDHMIHSMQASLALLPKTLGPYPHGQLRLVEHPGNGLTLHAYPINVSYEEEFPLLDAAADARNLDFPFGVVAHEVAHQWWGNKVTAAPVEGAGLLSESLAWYSALSVVQATYGDEHLERLLSLMREEYLVPRARADKPLLRASDTFAAYRKGPFAMSALRQYVGHARIDTALGTLVRRFGRGAPPLATSLDLYRELQAVTPDSLQYLLVDLFERNTFWELETHAVEVDSIDRERWRVRLTVTARKVVVDTLGAEVEIPMNDLVEIGVFAKAADGVRGRPLYSQNHRVRAGTQQLELFVSEAPGMAGIDPRHWLIDTKMSDNIKTVATVTGRTKP